MKSVIPVAAGILGLGALLYLYIRRREKDKKKDEAADDDKSLEPIELFEFVVKNQQVPAIMGRNSVILKAIEDKTTTEIRFRESDENNQICSIKGRKKDVAAAKQLIDVESSKPCVITDEILVPISSAGKIEGYSGSVLHEICSKSSAKVWVDPGSRKSQAETRRVLITGTEEQVALAKTLIEEKIKEAPEELSVDDKKDEFKREPRLPSPSQYSSNSSITTTETPREIMLPSPEKLKNNDGQLEVYVSAVNSPSRFWVQLVGPQSTELDFLVDAMTEYYNTKENQALHQIREPYLGQIVAAMFFSDNKWYRAEIVAIQVNETLPNELLFDVYFLDYGDSQFISKKDILELRADFLSLRFQAIECFLAHIQPSNNGSNLDEWDEKAVETFEGLVQAAQWKKLISKVVAYKERKSFAFQRQSKQRESSPIPGVELYDPDEDVGKNIAIELVKMGYADMTDPFGDLSKSSILNPNLLPEEIKPQIKETVKPIPEEKSEQIEEVEPALKEPEVVLPEVKELEVILPEVKKPEVVTPADEKVPHKVDEGKSNESNNNDNNHIETKTNGEASKHQQSNAEPANLFSPEKPVKKNKKKQQLDDFLRNEQQATSKKSVQSKGVDWNAMMDD